MEPMVTVPAFKFMVETRVPVLAAERLVMTSAPMVRLPPPKLKVEVALPELALLADIVSVLIWMFAECVPMSNRAVSLEVWLVAVLTMFMTAGPPVVLVRVSVPLVTAGAQVRMPLPRTAVRSWRRTPGRLTVLAWMRFVPESRDSGSCWAVLIFRFAARARARSR